MNESIPPLRHFRVSANSQFFSFLLSLINSLLGFISSLPHSPLSSSILHLLFLSLISVLTSSFSACVTSGLSFGPSSLNSTLRHPSSSSPFTFLSAVVTWFHLLAFPTLLITFYSICSNRWSCNYLDRVCQSESDETIPPQ